MNTNKNTGTALRAAPDMQTVAYVAFGAHAAILEAKARGELGGYGDDSELEFVDEIIKHALMLDRMADAKPDGCEGVFAYEIAEPFGRVYAETLIARADTTPQAIADALFAEMKRAGA